MNVDGKIIRYDGSTIFISAPFTDTDFLISRKIENCTIILDDGRNITSQQRKYIYAILRDIADYTGHEVEMLKDHFKASALSRTGGNWYSLSDCSMTEANELIETLIEFCVEWRIPTRDSLAEFAPNLDKYLYFCMKNKVCCITRREGAELHHVDHVGMGRDRNEIPHLGLRAMPLLRKYHIEAHTIGQESFESKYHIHGIPLTSDLCRIWGLREA